MDRINTGTKAENLFGAGKHGFRNGDLSIGVYPTDLDEDWFNGSQEELMSIIEDAGVVPDIAVHTKVKQAIKRLFGGNVTTINAANSPYALTADNAGLVIMDATAGNIVANLPAVNVIAQPLRFNFVRADATASTATVNCAGADTFVGGALLFTLVGQSDYRAIDGDSVSKWATLAAPTVAARDSLASLTVTVAANAMTGTLPAETLDFRSTVLTSGVPVSRTAAAAVALVVPNGATLGTANALSARIVWGWIDNAGALEPFVANLAGGVNLDETTLISTTAISAAADAANVIYSTVARANVAFRVRGFCDISEAAAGVWASDPTLVQPSGGQALAALASLGYGQTWQNLTGSRTIGTTYYNTTGKPISVSCFLNGATGGYAVATVNGVSIPGQSANAVGGVILWVAFVVPPGGSYSATISSSPTSVNAWQELR